MPTSVATLIARLKAAADAFDEEAAKAVCEELRQGILDRSLVPSGPEQEVILGRLRKCRWFALMQGMGEVLVAAEIASATARRQLGQALIEQGLLEEALRVVEALAADPGCPPEEVAEARGLAGRVHKQYYVDGQAMPGPMRRLALEASIRAYHPVYAANRKHLWHGINTVAMLLRGRRDGVAIDAGQDPLSMAREIVAAVQVADDPPHWDIASAAEACVALGDWPRARSFMETYVRHPGLDSFSAASTLRQLKQVWQLRANGEGGELISMLQVAVLSRTKATAPSFPERMHAPLTLEPGDLQVTEATAHERKAMLEKVFGAEGPRAWTWFCDCMLRARLVGRIEKLTQEGFGTGFLVRAKDLFPSIPDPNELLLVTNSHVLGLKDPEALRPEDCLVRFEALDTRRTFGVRELLFESPPEELDVTVARLDAAVTGAEPCELAPDAEPTFDQAVARKLNVIGHPKGGALTISIQDNLQVGWFHPHIHYLTPTDEGSSGSPVFDDLWRLIAVHHAGSSKMPRLDGKPGTYRANEGIWIHAVARAIKKQATPLAIASSPPAIRPQLRSGVFIGHARGDRSWLERVQPRVEQVSAGSPVTVWEDTRIVPGSNWLPELRDVLDRVSVAVLLVSSRFAESAFVRRPELMAALDAARAQGLTVVPVALSAPLIRPELPGLQPVNASPLDLLQQEGQEAELQRLAERVASMLDSSRIANGLRTAESLAYQAAGMGGTTPSSSRVENAQPGSSGLVVGQGTVRRTLLTFDQISRLPPAERKLIRAYEDGIRTNFERFTEAVSGRAAASAKARKQATAQMASARKELCVAVNGLLSLLERLGVSLGDHYVAARHICAQPLPRAPSPKRRAPPRRRQLAR